LLLAGIAVFADRGVGEVDNCGWGQFGCFPLPPRDDRSGSAVAGCCANSLRRADVR
jgi:hypothetical protein